MLQATPWNNTSLSKSEIHSMNPIMILTKTTQIKHAAQLIDYTNTELRTTMNLYLHTSVLASYDTLSNFNMDTIIKQMSVRITTS